jgi:hypothetical protein
LDLKLKELKAAREALRQELVDAARQEDLAKLVADSGEINIRIKQEEKFVTRSEDAAAFAELSFLVRRMGMDDYFVLDANGFMKDVYCKGRLPEQQKQQLEKFVRQKETPRLTVKLYADSEDED